jgi:uncharacterized protein (DUF433 family)
MAGSSPAMMTETGEARDQPHWSHWRDGQGSGYHDVQARWLEQHAMGRIARRHPRISMDPAVMGGKPCIEGTRLPVSMILEELGDGLTPEEVIETHPFLTLDDIRAAQAFAAEIVADEAVLLAAV